MPDTLSFNEATKKLGDLASEYPLSEDETADVLSEVAGEEVSDIVGDQVVTDERIAAVAAYPVNAPETRRTRRPSSEVEARRVPIIGEIEDNIPLPPAPPAGTYNWAGLKIGQSFFVTDTSMAGISRSSRIWAEKNNRKAAFEIRAMDGGFRVWRTA